MRGLLYLGAAIAVIGLAVWAYHENYRTQQAIAEAEQVSREIARIHEELAILRAEWAYLNRPDRLRALAALNFDALGLLPMRPEQFGRIDQVTFPPPPALGPPGAGPGAGPGSGPGAPDGAPDGAATIIEAQARVPAVAPAMAPVVAPALTGGAQ